MHSSGQSPEVDAFNPSGGPVPVTSLALQSDGKVLVGGWRDGDVGQGSLVRLNADGTVDNGFNATVGGYGTPLTVYSFCVQPDGKIVIAGSFTSVDGQSHTNLARLNPDGTLDMSFYPASAGNPASEEDEWVTSLALQGDGKIVLAGGFRRLNGQPCGGLGRLNADGTRDTGFNLGDNPGYNGEALAIQADGKIVVGGSVRLHPDGTRDNSFNPPEQYYAGAVVVQPDGKILLAGGASVLRLNPDGTLDPSFNGPKVEGRTTGAYVRVSSLALQADGKIVMGGYFYYVAGQSRTMIARLNPDGTLDNGFNPGPTDNTVFELAVQPDGKILAGGWFGILGGQRRSAIGRFNRTDTPTESLALSNDGSTITWLRGGTSPEVSRASFDFSADGDDWVSAGAGLPVAGGWRVSGLGVPARVRVRARGFIVGGGAYSSSWFVETISTPARVAVQVGGDTLDLSWSMSGSNLDLFSTSSLTPPVNWQPVDSPRGTNGSVIHVSVPCTSGAAFFQLRPSP